MILKEGQIWGDIKNKRRSIKIVRIRGDSAICIPVTDIGGEPAVSSKPVAVPLRDFTGYEILHNPAKIENPKCPVSDANMKLEMWFSMNPILKWLIETGTSRPQLSALVGVSVNTIHSWLTGRNPSEDNFPIIAAAIAMSEPDFRAAWRDWHSKRPTP